MLLPAFARRWYQALEQTLATYQCWNAVYLHPLHSGQAPHWYMNMQQAVRHAAHRCRRQADLEQSSLDLLAAALEALSTTGLETVIADLDRGRWPTQAEAIRTMSDPALAHVLADLEVAARAAR